MKLDIHRHTHIYIYINIIYTWATVNFGTVYSSKSSIFEECIIVFQVAVYKQILSFFEECIIVFQAPAQFLKKKMSRILLSINLILAVAHLYVYNNIYI